MFTILFCLSTTAITLCVYMEYRRARTCLKNVRFLLLTLPPAIPEALSEIDKHLGPEEWPDLDLLFGPEDEDDDMPLVATGPDSTHLLKERCPPTPTY